MDSAARLNIIKARLKPRLIASAPPPSGLHRASNTDLPPKPPKQGIRPPSYGVWRDSGYGISSQPDKRLKEWINQPDNKPIAHCAIKRTKKVNPLTRISEQLPLKLKRIG